MHSQTWLLLVVPPRMEIADTISSGGCQCDRTCVLLPTGTCTLLFCRTGDHSFPKKALPTRNPLLRAWQWWCAYLLPGECAEMQALACRAG